MKNWFKKATPIVVKVKKVKAPSVASQKDRTSTDLFEMDNGTGIDLEADVSVQNLRAELLVLENTIRGCDFMDEKYSKLLDLRDKLVKQLNDAEEHVVKRWSYSNKEYDLKESRYIKMAELERDLKPKGVSADKKYDTLTGIAMLATVLKVEDLTRIGKTTSTVLQGWLKRKL